MPTERTAKDIAVLIIREHDGFWATFNHLSRNGPTDDWPPPMTELRNAIASALRSYANQVREECARICDEPIHHQHPLQPPGVVMSITPASPAHAAAIRQRIHDEGKK